MKNETLQQTPKKFRDYQDTLLKNLQSMKLESLKEMKEFLVVFDTKILNQDEINNLNKLIY